MNSKYSKRIEKIVFVYLIITIVLMVLFAMGGVLAAVVADEISPEFTNYGSGDVEGWATILSGIGYVFGMFGRVLIYLASAILFACCIYFAIGMILAIFTRKGAPARGTLCRGCGTALAIWTFLPALVFIGDLILTVMDEPDASALFSAAAAAVCVFMGVFLLHSIYAKDQNAAEIPEKKRKNEK